MDYYGYFWGLLKYFLPIILFIISVIVEPNLILLIISVIWIMTSVFVSVLLMDQDKRDSVY